MDWKPETMTFSNVIFLLFLNYINVLPLQSNCIRKVILIEAHTYNPALQSKTVKSSRSAWTRRSCLKSKQDSKIEISSTLRRWP